MTPATVLVLAGAVLSGCVFSWAWQGDQTGRVASFLILNGLAFAAYLIALHAARGLSAAGLRVALAMAVGWRLVLVAAPPLLSDDVYRYLWEGRIQLYGGNPYAWLDRPEVEKWRPLRDEVWRRITHKDYTAVYPPLWQMAARGVVAVHDSVTAMKAFAVACELLTLGMLARALRQRGLPNDRLLILAWSPLALVEIAGSGHNEALGMLFLALALVALDARRPLLSALAAALGGLVKVVPALVALSWFRRYRIRHVLVAAIVGALLIAPYAGAGRGLWRTLTKYGEFWRFNETLFAALAFLMGSHAAAIGLALALLAVVALILAVRRSEPASAALAVIVAWFLLAPNVLPWYALWLLPLLVLRDAPGALLFTGTVSLAYLVYPAWQSGAPWRLGWGIRLLEYGPCLALAAWSWRRRSAVPPAAR